MDLACWRSRKIDVAGVWGGRTKTSSVVALVGKDRAELVHLIHHDREVTSFWGTLLFRTCPHERHTHKRFPGYGPEHGSGGSMVHSNSKAEQWLQEPREDLMGQELDWRHRGEQKCGD